MEDSSSVKKVYLIRHANSIENQRISSMFNCLGDLKKFTMPKKQDVGASLELLNISANHDAPLSEQGVKQCESMKDILEKVNFVSSNGLELVCHSPLQRAKQTCGELIGCSSDDLVDISAAEPTKETNNNSDEQKDENNNDNKQKEEKEKSYPASIQRVLNLSILEEKTHMEWVPGNTSSYEQRVSKFQQWLADQPESVICIVGHSQYFKTMLGLPFKFDNVDVYGLSFDPKKTTPNEPFIMEHDGTADEVTMKPEWYDIKLLHTCNGQKPEKVANDGSGQNSLI